MAQILLVILIFVIATDIAVISRNVKEINKKLDQINGEKKKDRGVL